MKTATDILSIRLAALYVLADREGAHGLSIKRELEDLADEPIGDERFYPVMSDLVEEGLVDKEKENATRSRYQLTEEGRDRVEDLHAWFSERLDGSTGQQTF